MNIQNSIVNGINDLRTGVFTNVTEERRLKKHRLHVSMIFGDIEVVVYNESQSYRLRRTREQAKKMADDLRWCLEVAIPAVESTRKAALQAGSNRLVCFLTPVKLPAFQVLDNPVYDPSEEALESYRFSAPPGTVALILGDNLCWGCECHMSKSEARAFLRKLNKAIVAWDEYI